tara:strand:- start:2234 stop:2470 length:237 start_codon:yes stop_codon:yes gene_type:complete
MQLELGQLIIDTMDHLNDVGLVVGIEEGGYGETIYRIYWTCHRPEGTDYSTTIVYSEDELEIEYSQWFEVIELKQLFS